MTLQTLSIERNGPTAWVWMNRPDVHNAFDETLIAELTDTITALDAEPGVRALVLISSEPPRCRANALAARPSRVAASPSRT